jgi:hypothetical protein
VHPDEVNGILSLGINGDFVWQLSLQRIRVSSKAVESKVAILVGYDRLSCATAKSEIEVIVLRSKEVKPSAG